MLDFRMPCHITDEYVTHPEDDKPVWYQNPDEDDDVCEEDEE